MPREQRLGRYTTITFRILEEDKRALQERARTEGVTVNVSAILCRLVAQAKKRWGRDHA